MRKNLSDKVNPRRQGIMSGGSTPKGWVKNSWSVPEKERKPCGFYLGCPDSKKCNEYGKIRGKLAKKFFSQCANYSWSISKYEEPSE